MENHGLSYVDPAVAVSNTSRRHFYAGENAKRYKDIKIIKKWEVLGTLQKVDYKQVRLRVDLLVVQFFQKAKFG